LALSHYLTCRESVTNNSVVFNNMNLDKKIEKSKEIICRALKRFGKDKIAIAWTGGKDSTVVLHLVRQVYGSKVPARVFFNDSELEFPEVLKFIKKISNAWKLDLIWMKHAKSDLRKLKANPNPRLARMAKIRTISLAIKKYKIKAFIVGIRHDEHIARAKEKYFSPRKNHTRIHPILHFTEVDVWKYIKMFKVPYVSLYDRGYRSLGEAPFTRPVGKNEGERKGRDQDKERVMKRLRALGYW